MNDSSSEILIVKVESTCRIFVLLLVVFFFFIKNEILLIHLVKVVVFKQSSKISGNECTCMLFRENCSDLSHVMQI